MPITLEYSPVPCKCGKPARRITVPVRNKRGMRMVSMDTHAECVTDARFIAAAKRLDRFHERVHHLAAELRALPADQCSLRAGRLIEFDIDTVHPDACTVRSEIIPTATVDAYSQRVPIHAEPRAMKGQSVKALLRDLVAAAEPVLERLARAKDRGDI